MKVQYDSCFNAWFEGYLEPIAAKATQKEREERAKAKAKEYEEKCGKVWQSYRACLQVRIAFVVIFMF